MGSSSSGFRLFFDGIHGLAIGGIGIVFYLSLLRVQEVEATGVLFPLGLFLLFALTLPSQICIAEGLPHGWFSVAETTALVLALASIVGIILYKQAHPASLSLAADKATTLLAGMAPSLSESRSRKVHTAIVPVAAGHSKNGSRATKKQKKKKKGSSKTGATQATATAPAEHTVAEETVGGDTNCQCPCCTDDDGGGMENDGYYECEDEEDEIPMEAVEVEGCDCQ